MPTSTAVSAIQPEPWSSHETAMLVTLLAIVLIVVLALYFVQLIPLDGRITLCLQLLIIVIAIVLIARAAGLG
jgi:heme/copper-type cytochrome/quinol oxidase subunit 4